MTENQDVHPNPPPPPYINPNKQETKRGKKKGQKIEKMEYWITKKNRLLCD